MSWLRRIQVRAVQAGVTPSQLVKARIVDSVVPVQARQAVPEMQVMLPNGDQGGEGDLGFGDVVGSGVPAWTACDLRVPVAASAVPVAATTLRLGAQGSGLPAATPTLRPAAAAQGDPSLLTYTVKAALAYKDTWVSRDPLCTEDSNHDGEDLQVRSVAGIDRWAFMAWDLSGWPAGTVTAAQLTWNWKADNSAGSADVDLYKIATTDEGWAEGTMTCSTSPDVEGAALESFARSSGIGSDQTRTLGSAFRTRIGDRLGVGDFTIVVRAGEVTDDFAWQSADEGTDDAKGPRLTATIQVAP